ncbi:hypothetical protein [Streptomyces sp.]|uniref:hypothetical protein n=1 Tax=Streptomyces sp. TaxID=1931 RepID=UPI002F42E48E
MSAASKEFVIITKRKNLAAVGVVALIAAGSTACGTAQATPQATVENALTKLSDQKSLTMGLSFDATADQIYSALQDQDDFTKADATMLASLRAQLAVSSEKKFGLVKSADQAGAFAFRFSDDKSGEKNLVEVVSVDKKLYLRADIKGIQKLDTGSGSSSDAAELNEFLAQADQLPSSLASVKAALKGEWIVIDPKAFAEFAKSFGGRMAGSENSPFSALTGDTGLDAKTQAGIAAALKKALADNATYKKLDDRDGADHVQVSVPAQQFAKELQTSLTPVLKGIPSFEAADLNGLSDVPNRTISVDLGVKGGNVSSVTFDVAQFDDTIGGKLPLTLTLDRGTKSISAPEGALQLNPQDLIGMFMADMPGSSDDAAFDDSAFDDAGFDPASAGTSGLGS